MKIPPVTGTYVGLGEGDRSPEIPKAKAKFKAKFKPARDTLDDGDEFTHALTTEVIRVQDVYTKEGVEKHPGVPKYVRGVINLEFKYDIGLLTRPKKILGITFTQEGHMSVWDIGPTASTASAVEQMGLAHWKPIGDWNTTALPFDKSGVDAWFRQLSSTWIEGGALDVNDPNGPKEMWWFGPEVSWSGIGFSRGAKDFSDFMEKYVLPYNAPLHYRLKTFRRGLAFGNPRRGKDAICSWSPSPPDEGTHGIMDKLFDANKYRFDDGRSFGEAWAENANDDDMFAEIDDDDAGRDQTAIAKIVTENSWGGSAGIFARVMKIFGNPTGGIYNAIKATFDAIMFLAKNPNPHYGTFATQGDIDWIAGGFR